MKYFEKIKRRRKELNISQSELAEMTGYTDRSSIAKIETGKVDLTYSKILLFAKALKTNVPYLLGWTQDSSEMIKINKRKEASSIIIFEDYDYALSSSTRKLKSGAKESLKSYLDSVTTPLVPCREDMIAYLNQTILMASISGKNYENLDDESLFRLYKEVKDETGND